MSEGSRTVSFRVVVVVLWVGILVGAATGATTYAMLVDSEQASVTVRAADSFDSTPPGNKAYNDADGNGRYDQGESTYTADELTEFDDETVNLVIPEDVGRVYDRKDEVSITARSIRSAVDIESRNGKVSLTASGGDVVVDGSSVSSRNGEVSIEASGDVSAVGATIESRNSEVSVSGDAVDLTDATLYSRNSDVSVTASGSLTADGATIASRNGEVSLESNGDMSLDDATIRSKNGEASAALTTASAVLSVDSATINDDDNTLVYEPSGVTVRGSTASGSVQSA